MADQKIRDRIRRLRELNVGRGCTEAEALAAAEKAAQLMRDHAISEADIVMDEQRSKGSRGYSIKAKLWPVIASCTNTAVLIHTTNGVSEVEFIGRAPGPEIAVYLRDVTERAIDRAVREFKTGPFYKRRRGLKSKRAAVADFSDGMVIRLHYRLVEVFGAVRDKSARQEAQQALATRYPDTGTITQREAPQRHDQARNEGWRAGEQVTLANGVTSDSAPLQIGGAQ
ncbi:MAG TPA: DUF2786 domain-containing protein [Mesorhizobium sp.]|jgi:hypothetical protein|uniref:DUF7168 domain-containing protein n=1 Tax=Mesorhizobium sp. TaxID=1871066 RepID=UPI002DDCF39F|nr:DUF2786 domain-containing protein [Mesorhizobium sp.]HEV2501632.1 DUF2786 domain-containing protein [Mesorhizobium sp.]